MKTKFNYWSIAILLLVAFSSTQMNAQEAFSTKAGWSFLAEPYVMFPNMSGKVGLWGITNVETDVSPSQIFDNLHMGAMLYLEASNEKWNINSDLLYMDLSQGIKNKEKISNGTVSTKQLGWEVAGLYKVKPWFQFGVGLLLNSIEAGIDVNEFNNFGGGTTNSQRTISQTWLDPMLIAVFTNKPGTKFIYKVRGEVGGFGLGGDTNSAWQVQAYAGYRFSELFQIQGGYRVISLNYATGSLSGSDLFLYDMDTYGPVIKFGFNF